MFPVLFFYLYLNSKEQSGKRKIITYILMGLTITIGSLNKFTVIIIAIAVGIDLLINRKFKEFTKILVSVVSIMMIFIFKDFQQVCQEISKKKWYIVFLA
jgi:4-amino-4-deoxy-L-arabinose transferase-like glycosyltransferase